MLESEALRRQPSRSSATSHPAAPRTVAYLSSWLRAVRAGHADVAANAPSLPNPPKQLENLSASSPADPLRSHPPPAPRLATHVPSVPDIRIAPRNKGAAPPPYAIWAASEIAPALWPQTVTAAESPPNAATLSRTHSSARRWSCRPRLRPPAAARSAPPRKPSAPRRYCRGGRAGRQPKGTSTLQVPSWGASKCDGDVLRSRRR